MIGRGIGTLPAKRPTIIASGSFVCAKSWLMRISIYVTICGCLIDLVRFARGVRARPKPGKTKRQLIELPRRTLDMDRAHPAMPFRRRTKPLFNSLAITLGRAPGYVIVLLLLQSS